MPHGVEKRFDIFRRRFVALFALCRREFRLTIVSMTVVLLAVLLLVAAVFGLFISMRPEDKSGTSEFSPPALLSISIVDDDKSVAGKLVREYFSSVPYIKDVFVDTFEQAQKRLEHDEIVLVMFLPPEFFKEASSGAATRPLEVWLNPHTPAESAKVGDVIRKYSAVVGGLYSNMYGYQRIFLRLTGDEDLSWKRATIHSVRTALEYSGRFRFARQSRVKAFDILRHSFAGLLIVLSLLPAFGVFAGTVRMAHTPLEDRLVISCGEAAPLLARLSTAFVWWLIIVVPWLLVLKAGGFLKNPWPVAAVLVCLTFGHSLVMSTIGRIRADAAVLTQAGWLLFFVILVTGGVLYPSSLFPLWLQKASELTPVYPAMRAVYRTLLTGDVPASAWFVSCWPLAAGVAVVTLSGIARRRQSGFCPRTAGTEPLSRESQDIRGGGFSS